jgi:AbrB family looped-hinge helix DNA binding protein
MKQATSRVTAQNQISIPASVRERFGIHPGTELIWVEREGEIVVRPKRYKLEDIQALLTDPPHGPRRLEDLRAGKIEAATRKARRGRR